MASRRTVISITPDLALDVGYTYAGGLGVLEGDKFYAAAKMELNYRVLSLYYENGYVDYEFDGEGNPVAKPQPQPREFSEGLRAVDEFKVRVREEEVSIQALERRDGTAGAIFLRPTAPDWATKLAGRIYVEGSQEEKFYKYTMFARAAESYIRRNVPFEEVEYIDLQEAYTALLPLSLRIPGKYRMVIHTAGPWGHPSFNREMFAKEYGYMFSSGEVVLTEIGLSLVRQAFAVSAKHMDVLMKVFPHHRENLSYITNGINLDRWMDRELKGMYENHELNIDRFVEGRRRLRARLAEYVRRYKDVDISNRFVVVWARRMSPYKRPDFPARLAADLKDLPIVFLLAGKAHPQDGKGLEYMRLFMRLHRELENVIYVPNYGLEDAKLLLSGGDLLLFTPFSGWEASGTSFMKAGVNGVPSISSRDGAALELIVDGVSGWLFGEDVRRLLDYQSQEGQSMGERDYQELKAMLQRAYRLYADDPEIFYRVGISALRSFASRAGMERVMREYYPGLIRVIA